MLQGKPVVQQLQTHLNASPLCRELKQKELQQELAAAKKGERSSWGAVCRCRGTHAPRCSR